MRPSQIRCRMELTLLTINTWKCDGDYYNRRAVLERELKKNEAQVILCQECFRSMDGSVDTLEQLSQGLGMPAWYVPCRRKERMLADRWVDSFSGLGILTSLPVTDHAVIDLPSDGVDGGRKAQLLTIGLASGQTLLVANIHLTHLPDDKLRRRQLQAIVEIMSSSEASFRIIGGDWNAETHSPILNEMMDTAPAADCYVLGQGAAPRYSLLSFFRRGAPVCVDHFFALPSEAAINGSSKPSIYPSFIRAGIVLDQPDAGSGLYPSDHFGICVTLTY